MLKQFNLKKSLISLSQFSLGEEPTATQVKKIQFLGLDLSKPFSEADDEHLLVTLHSLITRQTISNTSITPYTRTGAFWKHSLGFQHTDPASDIRGGGILSLHNLIFFLTNHPKKATQMIRSRANLPLTTDNTYPSFPWACAGINLTRTLALEFEIIHSSGFSNTGINAQYSKKTSWSYLLEENGFHRMYVCLFLLLDCLWDEMNATYMDFNVVLKATADEFELHLALSSSLINLENRIYKRVQFVDPDVADYTYLPDAVASSEAFQSEAAFDIEGQTFNHQRHHNHHQKQIDFSKGNTTTTTTNTNANDSTGNLFFTFFATHVPSYDNVMASLVPEPAPACLPDFLSSNQWHQSQQHHQHHSPLQHQSPYSTQIV